MKKLIIFLLISSLFAFTPVTVEINRQKSFAYAGFYIAKEKGFYKKEGLEVTIKTNNNIVNDILKNKAQFGIDSFDLLKTKNITIIGAVFKSSPYVFLLLKT